MRWVHEPSRIIASTNGPLACPARQHFVHTANSRRLDTLSAVCGTVSAGLLGRVAGEEERTVQGRH